MTIQGGTEGLRLVGRLRSQNVVIITILFPATFDAHQPSVTSGMLRSVPTLEPLAMQRDA